MEPATTVTPCEADIDSVDAGRERIDEIDASIRELVQRRREVSQQIQQLRRAAGGPRLEHTRENQVVAGYGDALGRPGVSIALAILDYCRGERPAT
jgi:chorismate mutase